MNETEEGRLVGTSEKKMNGFRVETDSESRIEDNLDDTHHEFVVERADR